MSKALKRYKVKTPVKNYCGVGAGGIQFAYGEAIVYEGWVLQWYREHGYTVEEIEEEVPEGNKEDTEAPEEVQEV